MTTQPYRNLRVLLFDDYDTASRNLVADLTEMIRDRLTFSTALHGGFKSCSLFLPMDLPAAWSAYGAENFKGWYYHHLEILEDKAKVWEGRVVDVSVEWNAQSFGVGLQAFGYWNSMRDRLYKGGTNTSTDWATGTRFAHEVMKEMVTNFSPDINGTVDIQSNVRDIGGLSIINGTWRYPQDIIVDILGPLADSNGSLWYFTVYDDRKPRWAPRDSAANVDWFIRMEDTAFGRFTRQGKHIRNHIKPFAGTTEGTGTTDGESTALYPRRDLVLELGTGLPGSSLKDAVDAAIEERRLPAQDQSIAVTGHIYSPRAIDGGPVPTASRIERPKYWVRSGQTLRIDDLIPAAVATPSLDSLRTFFILETEYDAIRDILTIVPDRAPGKLTTLLARLGQLERSN